MRTPGGMRTRLLVSSGNGALTRVGLGAAALVLSAAALVAVGTPAQAEDATCQGRPATIVATSDGHIDGTSGDDVIVVGDFDVSVDGGAGDDQICANAGHGAVLDGEAGDDTLADQPGDGPGETVLMAGPGADHFIGVADAAPLHGADLNYVGRPAGVMIDLAAGTAVDGATTDTLTGIHTVDGTSYADTFTGTSQADYYYSGDPDSSKDKDTVHMGAGDDSVWSTYDTVFGGPGDDELNANGSVVEGGAGDDYIQLEMGGTARGGAGDDWILPEADHEYYPVAPSAFKVYGGPGDDLLDAIRAWEQLDWDCPRLCARGTMSGGPGVDTLQLDAKHAVADLASGRVSVWGGRSTVRLIENVLGTEWADTIRGDGGPNEFHSTDGADHLYGRGGPDVLDGEGGNDEAFGGHGHDTCSAETVHSC